MVQTISCAVPTKSNSVHPSFTVCRLPFFLHDDLITDGQGNGYLIIGTKLEWGEAWEHKETENRNWGIWKKFTQILISPMVQQIQVLNGLTGQFQECTPAAPSRLLPANIASVYIWNTWDAYVDEFSNF